MDKHQVAQVLSEIAKLLELKGENPFKVRAYENAARIVEGLTEDIQTLIEKGGLTQIKGIGKNLADHIAEIVRTGRLKEYERLRKSVPEGVIDMLAIPGLGPKRVRFLWEEEKVKSVAELESRCKGHKIAGLPGFGAKTEEKILAGIASLKRFAGQHLYSEARDFADEILRQVRRWPEVIRCEVAGSVRRRKELVKDIDILAATARPEKVMGRFVSLDQVGDVVQHGKTKSEVILKSGIQCDLRAITDEQYPFALHYFTGSKDHNVAVRTIAKKAGIKMNEYGMFKGSSKKSIPCKCEKDVFGALGLAYIEPELRENMGEIEAAAKSKLPRLIEESDVKGVAHAHSTYTDGRNTIAEMAGATRKLGYQYIVIADHSQAVTVAGGMKPADVVRQHREIDRLNEKLRGFRILKGIEVDILADGKLDYADDLLAAFDVVIAAIHSRFGMGEKEMTDRIIKGISNLQVDAFSHPSGRLLLVREPYKVDLKKVIDAAAKYRVAMEINAHPQRLDLDWRWCKHAKERGVKFLICPDAHSADGLKDVVYGVGIARKGWLEKGDILNCLTADQLVKYFKGRT